MNTCACGHSHYVATLQKNSHELETSLFIMILYCFIKKQHGHIGHVLTQSKQVQIKLILLLTQVSVVFCHHILPL